MTCFCFRFATVPDYFLSRSSQFYDIFFFFEDVSNIFSGATRGFFACLPLHLSGYHALDDLLRRVMDVMACLRKMLSLTPTHTHTHIQSFVYICSWRHSSKEPDLRSSHFGAFSTLSRHHSLGYGNQVRRTGRIWMIFRTQVDITCWG